jgi:hypothetical protein
LLGYESNSRAYRVFNKDSGCVETTCDTVFDETNGFQMKQYDLDVVDDEEAPCEALQRMTIGEDHKIQVKLRPQMTPLHLHKDLIRMNMKIKINTKIKFKRRAMIKGEMRMMGIREKDHHTQECIKSFKEITLWTTFLVISKWGNY